MTKSNPFEGRYFFHFHTHLTDGEPTLEDYFRFAQSAAIDRLIFLEHIRRQPTYDVERFVEEIAKTSRQFGIPATVGFETKLLPTGGLDISAEHLALAEVAGIAEHGFPPDASLLETCLHDVVAMCRALHPEKTLVWAHPGLTFRKMGQQPDSAPLYHSLLRWARGQGVLIERNLRYNLVSEAIVDTVLGADAHSLKDCQSWTSAAAANKLIPTSVRHLTAAAPAPAPVPPDPPRSPAADL